MKKRKEMKGLRGRALVLFGCLVCVLMAALPLRAEAGTVQNDTTNPYVRTFKCPDGTVAWTISEDLPKEEIKLYTLYTSTNTKPSFWGNKNDYIYFRDAKINSVTLQTGQHFYERETDGIIELAGWRLSWVQGRCIHQTAGVKEWHGYNFTADKVGDKLSNCFYAYPSGWLPVCADCGEVLSTAHVYATADALKTIDKYDTSSPYYFICPNEKCRGLENSGDVHHECKYVSWNKYKVVYEKNATGVTGITADTYHMYGNQTEYEGVEIDPVTTLANSGFVRYGYTVTAWNTKPDGSGITYPLGYEIPDNAPLTSEQYDKEAGTGIVTLYAVWDKTESTLHIDPNGGSYLGKKTVTSVTKGYGITEEIRTSDFVSPDGYTTKFDSNGGSSCGDEKQSTRFDRLERVNTDTFGGKLSRKEETYEYEFVGKNKAEDTVKAIYEGQPIILPTPTKDGYAFGGWYKDKELTEFVGGGGDEYTPDKDRTLYASWSLLVLEATENYVSNNKKGASDLVWSDENHSGKYYKIFRSLDGKDFVEMLDAEDSFDAGAAGKTYGYTGGQQAYTVQATGYYDLVAVGAEGGAYGDFAGGKGGIAEGRVYLKKGDVLEIRVGGLSYGGGRGGNAAANGASGGGASGVFINGVPLIVAGGGGGATDGDSGKDGGAEDGIRANAYSVTTMAGQNASGNGGGGGGGYIGGKAGEKIYHEHTQECEVYHKHDESCYSTVVHQHVCVQCAGKTLAEQVALGYHSTGCSCGMWHKVAVWCNARDTPGHEPWCGGHEGTCTATECVGPWVVNGIRYCNYDSDLGSVKGTELTCEKTYEEGSAGYFEGYNCGHTENEVIGSRGAYGGSSYISTRCVTGKTQSGINEGNGYVSIIPASFGISGELYLNGVPSPDLKAPDKISEESVFIKPVSTTQAEVSFDMPADNGTEYYWQVQSFYVSNDTHVATSNIAKDKLVTGISGYRYVFDFNETHGENYLAELTSGFHQLSAPEHRNDGGEAVSRPVLSVTRYERDAYLHIAPVDVAGNVGPTIDIVIEPGEQDWTVVTTPMQVSDNLNGKRLGTVYTSGDINYVRADGMGVFKLSYDSFLDTKAREHYQIDYQLIDINPSAPGTAQSFITKIPYSALQTTVKVSASVFERYVQGDDILTDICNTGLTRLNTARKNAFFQCFSIPASYDGVLLYVTPVAGVTDSDGTVIYSKWENDILNAAKIMPDAKAPVISGFEALSGMSAISREEPGVPAYLTISATDALSGVKSLQVFVVNQSNGIETTLYPDASGKITIPLGAVADDDVALNGDLLFKVTAVDNVGNTRVETYGAEIFALDTKLVNAYEPTTNIIPQGGAGLLGMVTRGYAEVLTVELHDKLKAGNEGLTMKWIYNPTSYAQYDIISFEIPKDCPPGTYSVTVKATKNAGADVLFDYPELIVVAGTPGTSEVHVRIR